MDDGGREVGVFFEMEIKGAHIWGSLKILWGEMRRWVSEAHGQMCVWLVGVGLRKNG